MLEIGVRPSGSLFLCPQKAQNSSEIAPSHTAEALFSKTFNISVNEGLFALASTRSASDMSPSLCYWRKVACHYLHRRCLQSPSNQCLPIELLGREAFVELANAAPPMQGAEYLTLEVVREVWQSLDHWLCQCLNNEWGGQLAPLLESKAPHWHQVGRVCFHLAENPQDTDYPFAFMVTYADQLTDSGRIRFLPLAKALKQYAGSNNKSTLVKLLTPIDLAAKQSDTVQEWLTTGEIYHPQAWTANEAYQFIQQVPIFEDSGVIVRLPDWWKKRARAGVSVTIGDKKQNALNVNSLLDFNVHTVLGGKKLTAEEWQALLDGEDDLVYFKGQWVEVDRDQLSQALNHWQEVKQQVAQEGISFSQGMRLLAGMPDKISESDGLPESVRWSFIEAGNNLKTILEQMRCPENIKQATPGKALKAKLRPYQSIGVNWLSQLSQLGLGACLADDMGLGKTLQVIALLVTHQQKKVKTPSLLVLPASLMNNWKSEIERFAPTLRCHFIHPAFLNAEQMKTPQLMKDHHLVVTTYGILSRQAWLLEQSWQLVVLDEAQAIKNPTTKQSKTVKKLKAQSRVALTGTPIENRLGDLWSLFDFLCPGLLGSAREFKKYINALSEVKDNAYAPLRRLISPYILRRLKSDKSLIADLPDKTELHAYCELSKRQMVLYKKSVVELQQALEKSQDGIKRRGLVLSYLLRFKQICNHPAQWLGDTHYKPEDSGKFIRLAELAHEISARQEKVLIFTQFKEMTQVIADFLQPIFMQTGLVLHGGTSLPKRKQYVDDFQREDGPAYFVLSIKAGGTGLNLTAAAHVIHFDRWWNPAVENQATDRAYRIGQKKNVLVHKFVCKGTIEEKIDAMIAEKRALSDELLNGSGSEPKLTELNDDELIKLVSLDIKKVG